jgi:hypothetical protein
VHCLIATCFPTKATFSAAVQVGRPRMGPHRWQARCDIEANSDLHAGSVRSMSVNKRTSRHRATAKCGLPISLFGCCRNNVVRWRHSKCFPAHARAERLMRIDNFMASHWSCWSPIRRTCSCCISWHRGLVASIRFLRETNLSPLCHHSGWVDLVDASAWPRTRTVSTSSENVLSSRSLHECEIYA